MEQRSNEWFEIRRGRATASNIVLLLGKEGLKRTNDAIDNYAFEKALEIVHGLDEDDNLVSFDMQRGIDLEPYAFKLFKETKALDFIDVHECGFYEDGKDSGSSPDGITGNKMSLEIKCPKRKKYFKYVANGIKEVDKKHIAQMQKQISDTKSDGCYFVNYHIEKGEEFMHEIIIERDEVMINLIKERIKIFVKIRDEYVKKLTA